MGTFFNGVPIAAGTWVYNEYNVTRALTVVLSEEEWRQFRSLEPQPVAWLRERIREHIRAAGPADEGVASPGRPAATGP